MTHAAPDVSIVIVNWNSRDYLRRCLQSIVARTRLPFEVVVIDSGSFDGCGEMLREEFPWVRFIQADRNLGFARANNRAAAEARGEYLLFLNPDTELIGCAVDDLHAALTSLADAGAAGCRLLDTDGKLQTSCVLPFPTITNQVLDSEYLRARWPDSGLWGNAVLFDDNGAPREVEAVSGACLMLRRDTFRRVGGFSEDYFMYAEDVDLCHKIRKAGWKNYYVGSATVVHHGGSSSGRSVSAFAAVMMPEAIWRFLRKRRGATYGFLYRSSMLVSAICRILVLRIARTLRRGTPTEIAQSIQKWHAVMRWALGRDQIVRRFYGTGA